MTQGTTPSYIFTLKDKQINFEDIEIFVITLKSCSAEVTHNSEEPCVTLDDEKKQITLTLTQAETLSFKEGEAEMQLRGKFIAGTAFASKVCRVPVERSLYKEVI